MLSRIPLFLRITLSLFVLVSLGLWWWVPQWRFETKLSEAQAQIEERNFEGASATLVAALQARPGQHAGILRLIEIQRARDPEEAFSLAYEAHENGVLEAEDYPELIVLGFEVGDTERAESLLAHANATYPNLTKLDGVTAIQLMTSGRPREALAQLDEAIAMHPEWSLLNFWKGQLMRRSESRIDHIQAKQALQAAAEQDDFNGLRAILALADSTNLAVSVEEKRALLVRAEAHPWATPEWRMLALSGLTMLAPEQKETYVEKTIETFRESHPRQLGKWLNAVGEYARALEFIPSDEESLQEKAIFDERFRALTLSGRVEEAEALLATSSDEEDPLRRASRRFVLAVGQEDGEAAVARWDEALELAIEAGNEQAIVFLARGAMQIRYGDGVLRAYRRLFGGDFADRAPSGIWLDWFSAELLFGGERQALAVIREAATRFPEVLVAANNRLYLELVLDDGWEDSIEPFEAVLVPLANFDDPENIGATLALARLKQGRTEEARAIVEQLHTLKGGGFSDSTKVVEALVLAGAGEVEEAARIAETVDQRRVLPGEWALLAALRNQ